MRLLALCKTGLPVLVTLLLAPAAAIGAPTPVALGAWVPGAPAQMPFVDQFSALVGRSPAVLMWYEDWQQPLVNTIKLDNVAAAHEVPMITWEAWNATGGAQQPGFALSNVIAGNFDAYIRSSARAAVAWGRPLYIRLFHEMNIAWYPWGRDTNGNTPAEFVAAWRHVVTIFRQEAAANVRWVWSPNVDYGGESFSDYYPGDGWVDWTALDGYNWGTLFEPNGWQNLDTIFGPSYDILTQLSDKPTMIAETASAEIGGDKAAWIRSSFLSELPVRMPKVRAVIWFDENKETDWRVDSSPASLAAWRDVVASPLYSGTADEILSAGSGGSGNPGGSGGSGSSGGSGGTGNPGGSGSLSVTGQGTVLPGGAPSPGGGMPSSTPTTFALRARVAKVTVSHTRRRVTVVLSWPRRAPDLRIVTITGSVDGKRAFAKVAHVRPGHEVTVSLKLSRALTRKLKSRGGTLKIQAVTPGSNLQASRSIYITPH